MTVEAVTLKGYGGKKVWGVYSLWYYGAYNFYATIGHSENSPFCI
jgi:hypothetical protein